MFSILQNLQGKTRHNAAQRMRMPAEAVKPSRSLNDETEKTKVNVCGRLPCRLCCKWEDRVDCGSCGGWSVLECKPPNIPRGGKKTSADK